jgi:hypothetical protein
MTGIYLAFVWVALIILALLRSFSARGLHVGVALGGALVFVLAGGALTANDRRGRPLPKDDGRRVGITRPSDRSYLVAGALAAVVLLPLALVPWPATIAGLAALAVCLVGIAIVRTSKT